MVQTLHIRGARIWDDDDTHGLRPERRDLFTCGERIAAQAAPDVLKVDLEGRVIIPALINAHDHLELNHYPRSRFRDCYDNAHQWGEDMNARLDDEPYRSLRAYPLEDRCFIGGLKNLLCGALTVAHHNPPHKCLFREGFPVRVLREYGWAHSLRFNSAEELVRSYRSTPKKRPWFIHLAEGTDTVAAGEYQRLRALGCVGENTVIVHGIGMTEADIADAAPRVRALVWCPTTNRYLLGRSADPIVWQRCGGRVLIGSDSRLTADGDLIDEIRAAASVFQRDGSRVESAVWSRAAQVLRRADIGHLRPSAYADWLIGDVRSARAKLDLIVKGGVPQIGAPELMAKFPHVPTVAAMLDGVPKAIHRDLAQRIHRCGLKEPGLEVEKPLGRRFAALAPWKRTWERS